MKGEMMEIEKVRKILSDIHESSYYKILRMKERIREKEMRERIRRGTK